MKTREVIKRKKIAVEAAKKAGNVLASGFSKPFKVKSKGDRDMVTEIDIKAEKVVIDLIRKNFPDDGIFSEESPCVASKSGFEWIIDPMDGTHNFIHKIAIFGTSIAVAYKGEVIIGVIYMPVDDELYVAQKGKGAYKNSKKIHVSKKSLRRSTLIFDSSIRYNPKAMLGKLGKFAKEVFNVRMFGSSARHLSYVAEGVAEMDVEYYDKAWDFAAGLLIIEEAGGVATDFKGNKWTLKTKGYIGSNKVVYKDIMRIMRKSKK